MYDTTCVWPLEFSSGGTGVHTYPRDDAREIRH